MARSLPSGRVTFAFTDVVGSTRTFLQHGPVYTEALTGLQTLIADRCDEHGGVVVETEGDGAFLAFPRADSAVDALLSIQEELESANGPGLKLRIRAGAHVGDAVPAGSHYVALPVYVASRVASTANAGQLIVSQDLLSDLEAGSWSGTSEAVELGEFALKDIADPVPLYRLAGDPTPPRATPALRTNVPEARTTFLGRAVELAQLRELVQRPGLVTVVGPGGVGKTRMTSELATQVAPSFDGGAWLAELASIDDAERIAGVIGALLALPTESESAIVEELLRRGRTLLVLDNCEHILDGAAEFALRLVSDCPALSLLCTSREALAIPGEVVWSARPLTNKVAADLFVERASTRAGELDRTRVEELCQALDGLPLAVELAASQTYALPIDELLDSVLGGASLRAGPQRQRSLENVVDWSLQRLPPAERMSLLVLSVVPGRFGPEMASAVLSSVGGADRSALRSLARCSLIDLDGDEYRMLQTVREVAHRRLHADPALEAAAYQGLMQWAKDFAAEQYEIDSYHEDVPFDVWLALEEVLARGVDTGEPGLSKVWDLVRLLSAHWEPSARLHALARRTEEQLQLVDVDSLLVWIAVRFLRSMELVEELDDDTVEALERIARDQPDARVLVNVLRAKAISLEAKGELDTALALRLECVKLAEGSPRGYASQLGNLAIHYHLRGDFETEEAYWLKAEAASAEVPVLGAFAHLNLSELALNTGRPEMGRDRALAVLRMVSPTWRFRSLALAQLAQAHHDLGEDDTAEVVAREALRLIDSSSPDYEEILGWLEGIPGI